MIFNIFHCAQKHLLTAWSPLAITSKSQGNPSVFYLHQHGWHLQRHSSNLEVTAIAKRLVGFFLRQIQSSKLLGVKLNSLTASETRCLKVHLELQCELCPALPKGLPRNLWSAASFSPSVFPSFPNLVSLGWMGMPRREGEQNPSKLPPAAAARNEACPGSPEQHSCDFMVFRICQRGRKQPPQL